MAGNNGGPWGGGGDGDDRDRDRDRDQDRDRGGRRPGEGPQIPELDRIMKKGQEQLRVLMGGRGNGNGGGNGRGPGQSGNPFSFGYVVIGVLVVALIWLYASLYQVKQEDRLVKLFLGQYAGIGGPGLNFVPWPLMTATLVPVTAERSTDIGGGAAGSNDSGLMLTQDQNIVDVRYQVVWNISNPEHYIFNIADPADTVRAVSESAMRDIIARTDLAPILNKDRKAIADELKLAVQKTLDSYKSGINVIRVNLDKADPPKEVIDSFRQVQAAQQERDRLEKEADAYANKAVAAARGQAAQTVQEAEGYRAKVVNLAEGEASRFDSIYAEYVKAPAVTRKRMYLDTMGKVLGDMNKVILDGVGGGGTANPGLVPYLPLNELMPKGKVAIKPKSGEN